jgi:hypothetical protein
MNDSESLRKLAVAAHAEAWRLLIRAAAHRADAKKPGDAIRDEDDRKEFFRPFDGGPWFGLTPAA